MNNFCWLFALILGASSANAQQSKSEFHKTVDSINSILRENKLAYYMDTNNNGRYMKKIHVSQYGKVTVMDSIRADTIVPYDMCHKLVVTFNLFEIKKWDILFPYTYLKDKNGKTCGRIIGIQKADLFKLKEQFDKLTTLCR